MSESAIDFVLADEQREEKLKKWQETAQKAMLETEAITDQSRSAVRAGNHLDLHILTLCSSLGYFPPLYLDYRS
jgi:hypothetical protein